MNTFQSIFGTIRSILHNDHMVDPTNVMRHIEHLYQLDAQRCIEEVCPYVEQHLVNKTIEKTSLPLDTFNSWESRIPSLFEYTIDWPQQQQTLNNQRIKNPSLKVSILIKDTEPETLQTLTQIPDKACIEQLSFFHEINDEQLDVLEQQPPWPHLKTIYTQNSLPKPTLHRLSALPMIQHLEQFEFFCDDDMIEWTAEDMSSLNALRQLTSLSIFNDSLASIQCHDLSTHPNIQNIHQMTFWNIDLEHVEFKTQCPHLHELSIEECQYADLLLTSFLETMDAPNLQKLNAPNNQLRPVQYQHIARLFGPKLQHLTLSNNILTMPLIEALAKSPAMSSLQDISMESCGLDTQMACHLFAHLRGELDWLYLKHNDITAHALEVLAQNKAIHSLKHLVLANNPIQGNINALKDATWLSTLDFMWLEACELQDPFTATLLINPRLKSLKRCHLAHNKLDDAFCLSLTQGQPAWSDIQLSLEHNSIGPTGWRAMASWPGLEQIGFLNITGNPFDGHALRALGESPYIEGIKHIEFGELSDDMITIILNAPHFHDNVKHKVNTQR